jgi:aminopeptidase N
LKIFGNLKLKNKLFRIPANYRTLVYCTAIRHGGVREWEFASSQYDKELSATQRGYLQQGMACTKESWLISRYLNDQINATKVRPQDAISGLSAAAVRSSSNMRTWTFFTENWDILISK